MAYTPVLELLPGYRTEADRMRESLVHNIIRLDSMERMMNDMMTYNENIALVLEGRTPVVRSFIGSDSVRTDNKVVLRSREDSLLRAEMEGDGPYSLTAGRNSGSRREVREAMELVTPVEGIIAEHFDIGQHRFGVRVAAESGGRITAIDNGTVVQSLWTPDNRYIVVIQHANNLVSVYKNCRKRLSARGRPSIAVIKWGITSSPRTIRKSPNCSSSSCGATASRSTPRDISSFSARVPYETTFDCFGIDRFDRRADARHRTG